MPKRSPVNSKAILKSPLGGRDGSGSEEGRTRLAAPTREPFQQVSENAALNGEGQNDIRGFTEAAKSG